MRKTITICLVFCIAMSIAVVSASALANSGGGTWQYQKEIMIHENSGKLLTDYQVLVELSGSDFPTEAQPDGGDIRFTAGDGTELNYWIEKWDYSEKEAKVWVKVPFISANGETKIKMYYGNPSASAVSDGDKLFEFFDDFEKGLDQWKVVAGETWVLADDDGKKVLKGTSSGSGFDETYHGIACKHLVNLDPGIEIRAEIKNTDPEGPHADAGMYWGDTSLKGSDYARNPGYFFDIFKGKIRIIIVKSDGTEEKLISTPITLSSNKYYKYTCRICSDGTLSLEIRNEHDAEISSIRTRDLSLTYVNTYQHPGIKADFDEWGVGYWDNFIVRKYTSPEPTITIGAEQPTVKVPSLTLTKSANPLNIHESDATTITTKVENTGSADAKNIIATDTIPAEFTLLSGSMNQSYDILRQSERKTYQYTIKATENGRFETDVVSATYEDEKGNIYTSASNSVPITVDPRPTPTPSPTVTPTLTPPPTPSIGKPQLTISHTTLVEPKIGEETLITVSIENTGNGEAKNIKLRERIPSGLSIDYVDGADSTGNLVSWDGDLKPTQTHSIKHSIKVLTAGDKIIPVEVTYEDIAGIDTITSTTSSTIVITPVTPAPTPTPTVTPNPTHIEESEPAAIPWLYIIILVAVVLGGIAIIAAVRRKGGGETEVTIEENTK